MAAIVATQSFETGPANSAISEPDEISGGVALTYKTSPTPIAGSYVAGYTGTGTSLNNFVFGSATSTAWIRLFVYLATWPSERVIFCNVLSDGTNRAQLTWDANRKCQIRDGTTARWTSSTAIPIGEWVRYDWHISGSSMDVSYWKGANLYGTGSADESSGSVTYGGSTFNRLRFGVASSLSATSTHYFDWIGADSSAFPALPSVTTNLSFTDLAGTTDILNKAYEKVLVDEAGLAEHFQRAFDLSTLDLAGTSDTAGVASVSLVGADDDAGLSDSVSLDAQHTYSITANDDTGIGDTVSIFGDSSALISDDAGLSDALAFDASTVKVDLVGLTDFLVRDYFKVSAEDAGLAETIQVDLFAQGGDADIPVDDGTGATDTGQRVEWAGETLDDSGVSDSLMIQVIHTNTTVIIVNDLVGIVEWPDSWYVTMVVTVDDSAGLTDTAGVGKIVSDLTDSAGLSDEAAIILTPGAGILITRVENDDAGVIDSIKVSLQALVNAGLVRIKWDYGFDSYPRPRKYLWPRYRYPYTQVGLLVWRSGRVEVVTNFSTPEFLDADLRIVSPSTYEMDTDSWQANVLRDAGYELEEV